jgi:hypothetical protein
MICKMRSRPDSHRYTLSWECSRGSTSFVVSTRRMLPYTTLSLTHVKLSNHIRLAAFNPCLLKTTVGLFQAKPYKLKMDRQDFSDMSNPPPPQLDYYLPFSHHESLQVYIATMTLKHYSLTFLIIWLSPLAASAVLHPLMECKAGPNGISCPSGQTCFTSTGYTRPVYPPAPLHGICVQTNKCYLGRSFALNNTIVPEERRSDESECSSDKACLRNMFDQQGYCMSGK